MIGNPVGRARSVVLIAIAAGSIAAFLTGRPTWLVFQRWLMGTVLAALAVRMATEARR